MSMTKKDFIALADDIRVLFCRDKGPMINKGEFVGMITQFCKRQNPAFKEGRFWDYVAMKCGPNGGKIKKASSLA